MSDIEAQKNRNADKKNNSIIEAESEASEVREKYVENYLHDVLFGQDYATFDRQLWSLSALMTAEFGIAIYDMFETTYREQVELVFKNEKSVVIYDPLALYFIFIGIVLTFIVIANCGRRSALLLLNEINFCAFFLMLMSPGLYIYSAGTMLNKIAVNGLTLAHVVYLTEIAETDLRGFFAALACLIYDLGRILGNVIPEFYYPEYTIIAIFTMWPVLSILLTILIPESPAWNLQHGRPRLARKQYFWLNERTTKKEKEFRQMIRYTKRDERKRKRGVIRNIFSKPFVKPMMIILTVYTVRNCLIVLEIFVDKFWRVEELSEKFQFLISILRGISAFAVLLCVYSLTRRRLFLVSSACAYIVILIMLVAGVYFRLDQPTYTIYFFIFKITTFLGALQIPLYLSAEYFPLYLRDLGSAIVHLQFQYFDFYIKQEDKSYNMENNKRLFWTCWIAGTVCIIVLYYIMPNTDKLSLTRIQETVTIGPWIQPNGDSDKRKPVKISKSNIDRGRNIGDGVSGAGGIVAVDGSEGVSGAGGIAAVDGSEDDDKKKDDDDKKKDDDDKKKDDNESPAEQVEEPKVEEVEEEKVEEEEEPEVEEEQPRTSVEIEMM